MKKRRICIVTQSAEFAASAGMRIRYERLMAGSSGQDVEIVARPLSEVGPPKADFDCDAYIFCKTFTFEAIALAWAMKRSGKRVGQDLFDDYFSQARDQRLFQYREWLRQMMVLTDFVLCTTPRMREVLRPLVGKCPLEIVGDPVVGYVAERVASLASGKAERARSTRELRLAWFGIGDNPYFPVGLDDLTSSAVLAELAHLGRLGWRVTLSVATNVRALDPAGLAKLRRIPIPWELREWSEPVERELLESADVALLPVGGQGFSRAKSLNRAFTALEHGCQVLSLGEPLYERIGEFLYRDSLALTRDLLAGSTRLRRETIDRFGAALSREANAVEGARRFKAMALVPEGGKQPACPSMAWLHGRESAVRAHKLLAKFGGLSVRTPYTRAAWNFHVRFDAAETTIEMRVTPVVAQNFGLPTTKETLTRIGDSDFVTVKSSKLDRGLTAYFQSRDASPLTNLASYSRVMEAIERTCQKCFPDHYTALGDSSDYRTGLRRMYA